jgi:hypothetical protein
MSGIYQYLYEKDSPKDTEPAREAWRRMVHPIDECMRAGVMLRMYGRPTVADQKFIEHVIKKTPSGEHYITVIENVRPLPIANNGPIHGTLNAAQTYQARQSGAIPPPPAVKAKGPSPTPSVKRDKAERLLKEHGSPPHVHVTVGGRIVPNDLPQLGSPRMSFTPAFRGSHGPSRMPHAMPNGAGMSGQQLPNGFLGYNGYGKLIQWFDGRWHDVRSDGYGQPMYQMTPPNIPFPNANAVYGYGGAPPVVCPTLV